MVTPIERVPASAAGAMRAMRPATGCGHAFDPHLAPPCRAPGSETSCVPTLPASSSRARSTMVTHLLLQADASRPATTWRLATMPAIGATQGGVAQADAHGVQLAACAACSAARAASSAAREFSSAIGEMNCCVGQALVAGVRALGLRQRGARRLERWRCARRAGCRSRPCRCGPAPARRARGCLRLRAQRQQRAGRLGAHDGGLRRHQRARELDPSRHRGQRRPRRLRCGANSSVTSGFLPSLPAPGLAPALASAWPSGLFSTPLIRAAPAAASTATATPPTHHFLFIIRPPGPASGHCCASRGSVGDPDPDVQRVATKRVGAR